MERICETCGSTFDHKAKHRPGRYCSSACYRAAGPRGPQKDKIKGHRMISWPSHPLAPPSGILAYSRVRLWTEIGPGPHQCHWCSRLVNWTRGLGPDALVVDHLDFNTDNNSPENLVPACIGCNGHRRENGQPKRIEADEPTLMTSKGRTRAVRRNCEFCGKPFLALPAVVKKRKGRFCSRDCGYESRREARRHTPPDMSGASSLASLSHDHPSGPPSSERQSSSS
jgi:hypothetical protein